MKLLFVGDFSVQCRSKKVFEDHQKAYQALKEVKDVCDCHDFSIVNFESPITNSDFKILKDGPSLKNPSNSVDVLKAIGFNVMMLANNHIKDYGNKGIHDTINICLQKNIKYVGAGINIDEARKPLVLEHGGTKVGLINVCESEYSIASLEEPGTNPIDEVNLFYDINELKNKVGHIIVCIHGGREHYQLPTPRMKKLYRYIIDLGADMVVNHHQHCYSGYEIYKGKPIFYGLGNFYFDNIGKKRSIWNEGLMLSVDLEANLRWQLIPIEQCASEPNVKILSYESVRNELQKLNSIIEDDKLLGLSFISEAAKALPLSPMQPYTNHYIRALYHRRFLPNLISRRKLIEILNLVRCETHRDMLITHLETVLNNE